MKAIVLEEFCMIIRDKKINFKKGDKLSLEKINLFFLDESLYPWKVQGDVIEPQFGNNHFFIDDSKFDSIKKHLNIIFEDNEDEYTENDEDFDENISKLPKDDDINEDEYDSKIALNGMDIIELLMNEEFSKGTQIYCINTKTIYTFDGENFLDSDNCPISLFDLTYHIFVIKEVEKEKIYYTFNQLLDQNKSINILFNHDILVKHKDWECDYSTIQNVLNFMSKCTSDEIYSMFTEAVWDYEIPNQDKLI